MAVWVVSSRQLGMLLDRAREIDHSGGLQLVPGLFILAGVFLIHQFRKREEMRVQASAATARVAEMDRLVQFGKALAQSLDSASNGARSPGCRRRTAGPVTEERRRRLARRTFRMGRSADRQSSTLLLQRRCRRFTC